MASLSGGPSPFERDARPRPAAHASTEPLSYDAVVVHPDRLALRVRVRDEGCRRTSPALIARVLTDFPYLGAHACKNGEGPRFSFVMDHTSVPHLLEHLIVDLQTRRSADPSFVYVGTTQWDASDPLLAHVNVSFADDVSALRAAYDALAYLNAHLS